jgi:hypothetical protein
LPVHLSQPEFYTLVSRKHFTVAWLLGNYREEPAVFVTLEVAREEEIERGLNKVWRRDSIMTANMPLI